ncbi:MAG: hypothetical protein E6767_14975 [Dysgonomonas sp.]|nr:hypothetical protein [Dysgonomonas sp.]
METLKILSYTDDKYTQEHLDMISLSVNPASLKFGKGIIYREDRQLGSINGSNTFERYKPETLTFDFIIDYTGVIEDIKDDKKVLDKVKDLENRLYVYNSEGHRPSYVMIAYGELIFKGQLTSMQTNYNLFNNHGIPLRAEIKLEFSGFRGTEEDKKRFSKMSPDMSRLVVIKESDTLALLCHQIYGNSLLVNEVARFNNLNGFRGIPAGTEILFPPLKKN